ncbi:MAG: replication initiator protein A [Faecalibacterium prausnitzii]
MTYVLLLDRATLSQKNLWIDERGFVFVIFTICSLAEQARAQHCQCFQCA